MADNVAVERTEVITQLMQQGIAHHEARSFGDAVDCYSRVTEMLPDHGEAWRMLGIVALQTGDNAAARSLLERAIRIDAHDAAAYSGLGSVNESEGKLEAASMAYSEARAIDATQTAALIGSARVALALGNIAQAVALGEAVVTAGKADAGVLRTLGAARLKHRDAIGAAEALLASLRLQAHADAYANLAAACIDLHRIDAAIVACNEALILDPSHAEAANNLGCARVAQGAFAAAFAAFERAATLGSDDAHINMGTGRLLLGDYHLGWPDYGWVTAERRANPAFAALPMWDGAPAPGQRLLIWPEQGIGDSIQMARFVSRARALVGSVTLACQRGTHDLFRTVDGVDAIIDTCNDPALDAFDLWLPTIQLPVIFDIARESIPAAPYLRSDPKRVERFRPLLDTPARMRVGLVWAGGPNHQRDALRSCTLADLAPLQNIPGVTWFALQQGAARDQQAPHGMALVPINAEVSDFADTAAIISQLDLVITVDTSVANLAGALGRPAWVMLANRPDWRWQLTGDVSPWYPSLRLFRQSGTGGWGPVITAIADALRELLIARA